jgi:hypothetical protein
VKGSTKSSAEYSDAEYLREDAGPEPMPEAPGESPQPVDPDAAP